MDDKIAKLMSQTERDAVMEDIENARSLPAQAYASQDWFDLEIERIFNARWMAVMFDAALPSPGDVKPFDIFGMPLVAVRGEDAALRVFHNICPYDGCPAVLNASTGLEFIEVFYHGWQYDLTGRLVSAPFWNGNSCCTREDFGGRTVDLVEVRAEVRFGILFINLDGGAEPVDTWLAPWKRAVGEHFAIDELVPAVGADGQPLIEERSVAANWKTYQENASINILHEAHVHSIYRKSPEVPRVDGAGNPTFRTFQEDCFMAFSHDRDDSGETYDAINLPMAGHDPDRQPDVGFFSTLYPNINVPLLDAMIKVNIVIPVAPDLTRLMHLRFYRPEALASDQFQQEEQALQGVFDIIHKEDQVAIEAVQKARTSPVWRQHFYAPRWDALHHYFNQLVMADMENNGEIITR